MKNRADKFNRSFILALLLIGFSAISFADDHEEFGYEEEEMEELMMLKEEIGELREVADEFYTEDTIGYLKEEAPEIYRFFENNDVMKEKDELSAEEELELLEVQIQMGEYASEIMETEEFSPELSETLKSVFVLELEAGELIVEFEDAHGKEQREMLKSKLKSNLEESFDLRQELRRMEVVQIEQEIIEIQSQIEEREKNRRLIIDRYLIDMTEGYDPLEW